MRCAFLFLLCWLAGRPAVAQPERPRGAPGPPTVGPSPAGDTLAALHRLFAHRRRQQAVGALGILTAAATAIAIVSSKARPPSQGSSGYGVTPPRAGDDLAALGIGLLALPVLVGEMVYFDRYNRAHEQRASDELAAHKLSPALKRRLKPKFFRPA